MLNKQVYDYSNALPYSSSFILDKQIQNLLKQDVIEKVYYSAMRDVLRKQPLLAYKQLLEDKVQELNTPVYISVSLQEEEEQAVRELSLNYFEQLTKSNFSSDSSILNKLHGIMSHEEVKGIRYKALRNAVVRIGNELNLTKEQQDDIHLDGDLIEECIQHGYVAYIQIEEEVC